MCNHTSHANNKFNHRKKKKNNNIICSDPNKGLQLKKNPRKITSRLNRTLKFCILVTFDYNNQSPSGLGKEKQNQKRTERI